MYLTVLIWLIKIAAFVWVSGSMHLCLFIDWGVGGEVKSRKKFIYIYLYLYSHIKYNLLFMFTLLASSTCSPMPKQPYKQVKEGRSNYSSPLLFIIPE